MGEEEALSRISRAIARLEIHMDQLEDKVAVVTGAASGIGLSMTEQFLKEGMKVVMADIEQEALERESKRLGEGGGKVAAVGGPVLPCALSK